MMSDGELLPRLLVLMVICLIGMAFALPGCAELRTAYDTHAFWGHLDRQAK